MSGNNGNNYGTDREEITSLGEVFFEFRLVGAYMRVNAIHAATGEEIFVLGPFNARRGDLQLLALRKLARKLSQKN